MGGGFWGISPLPDKQFVIRLLENLSLKKQIEVKCRPCFTEFLPRHVHPLFHKPLRADPD